MRKLLFGKRRLAVIGATTAIALAGGGAAFAYFSSSGSGTGHATVGTSTAYTVTVGDPVGPALVPVTPTGPGQTFTYTVKNNDAGPQTVTGATITVTPDASHATAGCLASWYQVSNTNIATPANPGVQVYTTPVSIAAGDTSSSAEFAFTVKLIDSGTNQDVCKGDVPSVVVAVS